MKELENNKMKFDLSRCKIYDVFIVKNNTNFYLGQIKFTEENNFWKTIFSIDQKDKNSIEKNFYLKQGDTGFFATFSISENDLIIKINIETRTLKFFDSTDKVKLERNYNFT
jgi:hypothetical protein